MKATIQTPTTSSKSLNQTSLLCSVLELGSVLHRHRAPRGELLPAVTSSYSSSHLSTSWNFFAASFSSCVGATSRLFSAASSSGRGARLWSGSYVSFSLSEVAPARDPYVALPRAAPGPALDAFCDPRGFLSGAGRRMNEVTGRRERGATLKFMSSSSSDARPEISTSSSELSISYGSRLTWRRLRGRRVCN